MANLTFRQGILRHAQDSLGTQGFIDVVGNYANLMAADEPTVVAFAHGDTNYIFSENSNVTDAWGPLNPGSQYWLYWDLDKKTGTRTFGFTQYSPITQASAPSNPIVGQMWFDTIHQRMFERTPNGWTEVIRVLACRIDSGRAVHSVSKDSPRFTGTQVGITGNVRAGGIIFDLNGYPIKKQDKTFFTTEDDFMTGLPSGASLRISNVTLSAVASMPLARHQVVEYSGFGRLKNATPYGQTEKLLGIIEHDAITGDDVSFSVEGMFFDDDWSWQSQGASAGDHVFINETGEISLSPAPNVPGQFPVGIVIGPQEIMFAPAMMAKGTMDSISLRFEELSNTPPSLSGHANHIIRVNSTATGIEFVQDLSGDDGTDWGEITGLIGNQTDLSIALDSKSPVVHTHTKSEINDFDHTHALSDITDFNSNAYATYAQGALANTAIQPNDNISTLTNDVGFVSTETDPVYLSQKGQPNGAATLDSNGKIIQSQIPSLAINDTFVVNNEVSMLALGAETGDIVVRTDINRTFILQGTDPSLISEWVEILSGVTGASGSFSASDALVTVSNGAVVGLELVAPATYLTPSDMTTAIGTELSTVDPDVILHSSFDETAGSTTFYEDISGLPWTTFNDAVIVNANSIDGNALDVDTTADSARFDLVEPWLVDSTTGTDFTIEGWITIMATVSGSNQLGFRTVNSRVSDGAGSYYSSYILNGSTTWCIYDDRWNSGYGTFDFGSYSQGLNNIKHVAMVKEGNRLSTYIDGVRSATITGTGASPETVDSLILGGGANTRYDEVRMTKGAKYTGTSYTVPTAPFPPVSGTTSILALTQEYTDASIMLLEDETSPTLNATLDANNNVITNVDLARYFETVTTPSVSATTVIDFATATVFNITLTSNTTLSVLNPAPTGKAGSYTLVITQDGTGGRTVTPPASFTRGGLDIATGAGQQTIVTLLTMDGGVNYTVMTAFKEGA